LVANIQQRLLKFVTRSNWILLLAAGTIGLMVAPLDFALGIIAGGLIVTVNFHLLHRTLKRALTPPHLVSHNVVLVKYYLRFFVSGLIIFFLIAKHLVNPLGLFVGLSIVVCSILLATACEVKKLILKEAT
jgi:hypothetical protein